MYLYDIEKDLKKKIIKSEICVDCCGFTMNDGFIYKVAYKKDSHFKYNLFYKKLNKKEPIKLDSEVNIVKITPNGQGVFYTIEGKGIFYKDLNKKNPVKIYDKAEQIYNISNDKAYIIENINNKENLYELGVKGNKKVLAEDINLEFIEIFKDNIAYLKNNILYIGSVKMAENIKEFYVKEKDIVCLTTNNKMFILKDGKTIKELIENVKKYKKICILNKFKYNNILSIKDIIGYWVEKDNKNFMFKIDNDTEEIIGLYSKGKYKITSKDNKYKSMTVKLEGAYTEELKFIDNNNMEISGKLYKKIDKKTFENFKNKLDRTKKVADAYLKEDSELLQIYYDKNNKEYFIYKKKRGHASYVMVDEFEKLFDYNSLYNNFYKADSTDIPDPIKI